MAFVEGTFAATGQSDTIKVRNGAYALSFGEGSVTLQRKMSKSSDWVDVRTITADEAGSLEGHGFEYRLNCTSYTSAIKYEVHAGV